MTVGAIPVVWDVRNRARAGRCNRQFRMVRDASKLWRHVPCHDEEMSPATSIRLALLNEPVPESSWSTIQRTRLRSWRLLGGPGWIVGKPIQGTLSGLVNSNDEAHPSRPTGGEWSTRVFD
jgi:hypothetical protein